MNISAANDCILIAGFTLFAFFPFDRKRSRLNWAKQAIVICAIVGVARGLAGLASDMGWFAPGNDANRTLDEYLHMASGVILGLVISLILSGQLLGVKRDAAEPME